MTLKKLGYAPRKEITISKRAIEEGIAGHSGHCLFAESIKDAIPGAKYVSVDIQTMRFSLPEKRERYTYLTPYSVQREIINFDQGHISKAFTFRLSAGHTTRYGNPADDDPMTVATRKATREKKRIANQKTRAKLRRAKTGNSRGTVPERVGGKTPPLAIGRRRSFGLRSFEL